MDDGELDKLINELEKEWVQSLKNSSYYLDFTDLTGGFGLQKDLKT